MYQRHRNIVQRQDGRPVNVARSRGQLFVCADACCCGRVEEGMAPVPRALYHAEWERRRLRNIVHLTIGGCLGPCALANVAMLLFDGQTLWFHSVNSEALALALYDYVEALLDADRFLPPPPPLAALQFTATTWQPRPDGQPVEDHRQWEKRKAARRRDEGGRLKDETQASCDPSSLILPPSSFRSCVPNTCFISAPEYNQGQHRTRGRNATRAGS